MLSTSDAAYSGLFLDQNKFPAKETNLKANCICPLQTIISGSSSFLGNTLVNLSHSTGCHFLPCSIVIPFSPENNLIFLILPPYIYPLHLWHCNTPLLLAFLTTPRNTESRCQNYTQPTCKHLLQYRNMCCLNFQTSISYDFQPIKQQPYQSGSHFKLWSLHLYHTYPKHSSRMEQVLQKYHQHP